MRGEAYVAIYLEELQAIPQVETMQWWKVTLGNVTTGDNIAATVGNMTKGGNAKGLEAKQRQ